MLESACQLSETENRERESRREGGRATHPPWAPGLVSKGLRAPGGPELGGMAPGLPKPLTDSSRKQSPRGKDHISGWSCHFLWEMAHCPESSVFLSIRGFGGRGVGFQARVPRGDEVGPQEPWEQPAPTDSLLSPQPALGATRTPWL